MGVYILCVLGLIRKHLQKGEVDEDKVILINREGRVTEVAADMLDMEEDVMVWWGDKIICDNHGQYLYQRDTHVTFEPVNV